MCTVLLLPGGYPIAVNKYIISYHIISYHIISYHIISYHIIPYHITTYHIISYYNISYHISYHIISYHIISYHIISYHIISYHIISYHIISYHINIFPRYNSSSGLRVTDLCWLSAVLYLDFLGAFANLQKATISFVMSVRPSVSPHGTTRFPLDGIS